MLFQYIYFIPVDRSALRIERSRAVPRLKKVYKVKDLDPVKYNSLSEDPWKKSEIFHSEHPSMGAIDFGMPLTIVIDHSLPHLQRKRNNFQLHRQELL